MALSVKVGTYTGNGATSGTRAITGIGFQPKFMFVWSADTVEIYPAYVYESAITGLGACLGFWGENGWASSTSVYDTFNSLDSDGFTIKCGSSTAASAKSLNKNAVTFYYLALGGADVYSGTYTGNATDNRSITGVGFQPAFVWTMGGSDHSFFKDSGSGSSTDTSSSPYNVADVANGIQALETDGFQVGTYNTGARTVNVNLRVYYYVAVKASADFYSGQYTGNGSDNRDITAPGFQPNYIWIKDTNTAGSAMRSSDMSGDNSKYYRSSGFAADRIQSFISTGFQIGTAAEVNTNTRTYNYFTLKVPTVSTFTPQAMWFM